MKATVVYSTRFGATEKIARSLEAGLKRAGLETTCENVIDIAPESLGQYDLLCLGGPTETLGLSKKMDQFMESMKSVSLNGKSSFAFDTKYGSRGSGSAAKCIQNRLGKQGLNAIARRKSAIVTSLKSGATLVGAILKDGEEKRFEQIGYDIGTLTIAKSRK